MHEGDRLESYMDVIDVDDSRLEIAAGNLAAIDVIGLHERYDELLGEVRSRFGWTLRDRAPWRVSEGAEDTWHVSDALRRRIVEDNRADLEFYEYARELVAERVGS
jgi:hypothetical protein